MEFYFDSARKTIIVRDGINAVGIRPNGDSIEFFTPEYRVFHDETGDLMFPGYILSPLQYSDITYSVVAFYQKYVTIEKVIKAFFRSAQSKLQNCASLCARVTTVPRNRQCRFLDHPPSHW